MATQPPAESRSAVAHRLVAAGALLLDVRTPEEFGEGHLRLLSLHPGVTVQDVVDNTGFEVRIDPAGVPATRAPTLAECQLIRDVLDPKQTRKLELK